jgi:hypothetical protein
MTDAVFKPVHYLKQNCPICLKVRLFLPEAGVGADVDIRDFATGPDPEEAIRAELSPHLDKVSFSAAQLESGPFLKQLWKENPELNKAESAA